VGSVGDGGVLAGLKWSVEEHVEDLIL